MSSGETVCVERAVRRRRSIAEKRGIVEEALVAGASVAAVARAHGVNANQVFGWRRLYQAGRLGPASAMSVNSPLLLPVRVEDEMSRGESTVIATTEAASQSGTIHIQFANAQLRIEGAVDPKTLHSVLECLRR